MTRTPPLVPLPPAHWFAERTGLRRPPPPPPRALVQFGPNVCQACGGPLSLRDGAFACAAACTGRSP